MKDHEFFRPMHQPARAIYDAFIEQAKKRNEYTLEEWIEAEEQAVWRAARDYAQQHGLPVPDILRIRRAEYLARGHIDYAAKWAYGVAEYLQPAGATS